MRVVAARDGGLCRIRLPGGVLKADEAHAIADAARAHASGVIELTNRANVQVRGVKTGRENALSAALIQAGLGPEPPSTCGDATALERAASADDLRNLMLSPLAGRDPNALFDTTTLVAPVLDTLQREPRFAALSPKFALLLDGGERLAALDHPHDIWLAAARPDADEAPVRFVFGLAGCPADGGTLAAVAPEHVPALIRALLLAFLDLAAPEEQRMRAVLARVGADAVLRHARRHGGFALEHDAALQRWRRPPIDLAQRLGAHALHADGSGYVGAQPPLGRLDSDTLDALASLAASAGDATLRITPWQGVMLHDVRTDAMAHVVAQMHAAGLIVDHAAPLARLIACTGSAGCAKSRADTKADALRLAAHLPAAAAQAHLSGCERSCAAAHRAPWTLLAVAPGHYDLYARDDDAAGFGHRVACRLTIEAAAETLARPPRSHPDA